MKHIIMILFIVLLWTTLPAQETDTTTTETRFYTVENQFYDIEVQVGIINGFAWSLKDITAQVIEKEDRINAIMKKYYRLGFSAGWSEREKRHDNKPIYYFVAGLAVGAVSMAILYGTR